MDPRKARDPRLARGDPRLQNRPPANSPTPTPAVQVDSYQVTNQINVQPGLPAANSQNLVVPGLGIAGPSNYQEAASTSTAVDSTQTTGASRAAQYRYKPKTMFCVVCASNQVSVVSIFYIKS